MHVLQTLSPGKYPSSLSRDILATCCPFLKIAAIGRAGNEPQNKCECERDLSGLLSLNTLTSTVYCILYTTVAQIVQSSNYGENRVQYKSTVSKRRISQDQSNQVDDGILRYLSGHLAHDP